MEILTKPYYDPKRVFYVCSYGGCGSKMLVNYLSHFGETEHIHSRKPPLQLTYIGDKQTKNPVYCEWFNDTPVPPSELKHYHVIFIYNNPVRSIYSRFQLDTHLDHIQCPDPNISLSDVLASGQDLYGINEFFDNYTQPDPRRNYPILCVKYGDLFTHLPALNAALGIPSLIHLFPLKQETKRVVDEETKLVTIYQPLIDKMKARPFVFQV